MKILIAPDSFKGSLTAMEICNIVEKSALKVFPKAEVIKLPIADGGEGTVESVLEALHGEYVKVNVKNPLGEKISACYGIFNKDNSVNAIIEMAQSSGLPLIPKDKIDIMKSNTYGTGEMVLSAIDKGCKTIYIGLGGSATNDGGMGFACAIGVKFLDKNGVELEPLPTNLDKVVDVDISHIHDKIKSTKFIIISDVQNPLLGDMGATNVFAKQKGATVEDMKVLENGLKNYITVVENKLGVKVSEVHGSGSAGGLGAGLLAFCNSTMQSGVETVLDILDFEQKLKSASLVVTGEGKMDYQSACGKVAYGVGMACKSKNIPCVALVGGLGEKSEDMFNFGIDSMMTTVNGVMSIDKAITKAKSLCENSADRMFRLVKVGMVVEN